MGEAAAATVGAAAAGIIGTASDRVQDAPVSYDPTPAIPLTLAISTYQAVTAGQMPID